MEWKKQRSCHSLKLPRKQSLYQFVTGYYLERTGGRYHKIIIELSIYIGFLLNQVIKIFGPCRRLQAIWMVSRRAGCMGNPLVRFREGLGEQPKVWLKYCGTAGKPGGKRRKQTSAYSRGRPQSTRHEPIIQMSIRVDLPRISVFCLLSIEVSPSIEKMPKGECRPSQYLFPSSDCGQWKIEIRQGRPSEPLGWTEVRIWSRFCF